MRRKTRREIRKSDWETVEGRERLVKSLEGSERQRETETRRKI